MKKRIVCLFLSALLALTAFGCAPAATPEPTSAPSAVQPEPGQPEGASQPEAAWQAGTYTGSAAGNNGEVTVSVTLSQDAITGIEIVDHHETYYIFSEVKDTLPARILEAQSLAVDTVSGATNSSRAVLTAVANALESAGADAAALQKGSPVQRSAEILEVDALVVGAGFSGMTAANRLQQNGVDVLLIEQLDFVGGSARFSGGSFMMADSEETLKQMEDFVSTRLYYGDFPVPDGAPDLERIHRNMAATMDAHAMFEELGVQLDQDGYVYTGSIVEKYADDIANSSGYVTRGACSVEQLLGGYLNQGGRLMTGVKATELIQDGSGAVVGALAASDTCDYTIRAKAVILATGSYTHNKGLLEQNLPGRADDLFSTSIGADGSGIEMALAVGGVMTADNYLNGGARLADPVVGFQTQNGGFTASSIIGGINMIVGRDGARLASELDDRYFRYYTYEDGPDQFFAIYAGDQLAEAGQRENFDALASEEGPYYKADTLEELGRKCGFDAALFSKSLSEYNSFCETGIDVFELAETAATHVNADTLAGTAGSGRKPIVNGPFYATRVTMVGFDIIGGVKTGSNGEVLRADGSAIPGLYGVGFFSSRDYMGSGASHYYCLMLCVSSGMVTADAVTAAIQ